MSNPDTNSTALSPDDPLHIHSSDHPGLKLVAHPFQGVNFGNWKRSMLIALSAKKELCFVDGTSPKPNSTSKNAKNWQRCNDMVFSWILNALSSEIADSILYSVTAKCAWDELIDRYDQSNGTQLYGVHKKLSAFSQENDSITTYFTKLKSIWDEIDAMGLNPRCTCSCACGAVEKQAKFREDQRVVQFLMGLNDDYSVMRGTTLMQNPLPKLSTVYNNLIQEERQREIRHTVSVQLDSASLYAKGDRNNSPPVRNQRLNAQTGQNFRGRNNASAQDTRNVFARNTVVCNYCKRPGHTIDKCYRLQNRNRRFANNAHNEDQGSILGAFDAVQNSFPCNYGGSTDTLADFQNTNPNLYDQTIRGMWLFCLQRCIFYGLFHEDASGSW